MNAHRRHDISDQTWALLEPHLPGRAGAWGGNARDNRLFINAVLWILRTGAPWRDLPPDYGSWSNTHRRFIRWRDKGIWGNLLTKKCKTLILNENLLKRRDCNWALYKLRHLVENAFLSIKRWRGLATRYAKNASSFLAAIQIRCLMMWLNIS